MSEAAVPFARHPLERGVAAISAALDSMADSDPLFLTAGAKADVLTELTRQIAQLEGLRSAVLEASGDVADEAGARSPGLWLAARTRLDSKDGRRLQKLADALKACPLVLSGFREGRVSRPQVEVIVKALGELPAELDPQIRVTAEARLVEYCDEFTPRQLEVLGRRILDVVAPEVAEEHERKALERSERRARRRMRVTTRDIGDGLIRTIADLPQLHTDLLLTQLHAYASPRRDHLEGEKLPGVFVRRDPATGERISYPTLLAQAFCSLLERLPRRATPAQGGDTATLLVTLDLDSIVKDSGVARLSTGNAITAGEARRLACSTGVVPMVLDGTSQPLDVGRKKRFHTPAMRKALAVRDKRCRAAGCDMPVAWCEAHHLRAWSEGGGTNLDDAVLLCGWHHHRAHDKRYDMTRMANGDLRFHRRG